VALKDLGYKPRRASVRIVLDDSLRQATERARADYALQKLEEGKPDQGLPSELPELRQRVEETEAAADQAAVEFVFEALPRRRIAELVHECPPTTDQLDRWKISAKATPLLVRPAPEWDYETFAPRLIAASLVSPEAAAGEVVEMWETGDWSDAIWEELWQTAWSVNQEVATRPTFGSGSAKI
jgi:hypothetical protein